MQIDNTFKKFHTPIGRETSTRNQQSSIKSKDFSRTFTPQNGGMALNGKTSIWAYRPPMVEFKAQYASELHSSEDNSAC